MASHKEYGHSRNNTYLIEFLINSNGLFPEFTNTASSDWEVWTWASPGSFKSHISIRQLSIIIHRMIISNFFFPPFTHEVK